MLSRPSGNAQARAPLACSQTALRLPKSCLGWISNFIPIASLDALVADQAPRPSAGRFYKALRGTRASGSRCRFSRRDDLCKGALVEFLGDQEFRIWRLLLRKDS